MDDEQAAGGRLVDRFEAMVSTYSGDVYRYAVFLCRDRSRAEDLTQESFLRAWRSLTDLREDEESNG